MRHEVGHVQIARGEVDPKTVRQRITKTYGIGHTIRLSMLYAAAYEGSGMTGGEIWEEIICDSLGDMNIFQGYNVEEQAGRLLNDVRENMAAETRMDRGPPAADLDVVGRMSKEKWWPDLTKSQMADLRQWVKRDIRTSENSICETANWTFRSFNGLPVFAIYSTVNESEPTILYESKGAQAEYEKELLEKGLERIKYGKSVNGKPGVVDFVLSGSGVRTTGSSRNDNGPVGRDGGSGNAGVLQKQSKRKPSAAFKSVIQNLLEVRETGAAGKRSRELDLMHVAAAENGRLNHADEEEYLAFIRQLEEVQVHLKAEELRQEYLQNMARLEEAEREAEMDAAFWKGFDR